MSFDELPESVKTAFFKQQLKEAERVKKYGHVRPPIVVDHQGYKVVAVGSKLMWAKEWKTFHDFLFTYIAGVLSKEWGDAEVKKPYEERHPILQWYHQLCEFQRVHAKPEGGEIYTAVASGPVIAYLSLAYDLYTLEHHSLLQEKLVQRLKNKDQFQGARYEVFAAAAFIRAGFDVRLEDETDSETSHCEFVASYKETGANYSVEAKSRHREGYLGKRGRPRLLEEIKADVYALLQRSLRKRADHERIVFIDVNVPPEDGGPFETDWFKRVADQLRRLEETQGDKPYPPAFVFFTNHPYHYVGNDRPEPGRTTIFTAINMPEFKEKRSATAEEATERIAQKHPAIMVLYRSVTMHTEVPHSLE